MNTEKLKKLLPQYLKFSVAGISAFLIEYGGMIILKEYVHLHYLLATMIAYIISVLYNYVLSSRWVFPSEKKKDKKVLILFILLGLIGLGLNELLMLGAVSGLGIDYKIAKLAVALIVSIYNFISRKILFS